MNKQGIADAVHEVLGTTKVQAEAVVDKVVDAIVGHELSALWQNQNLIDALTGYYQPQVGHLQEI